jgi:hypothetical protein
MLRGNRGALLCSAGRIPAGCAMYKETPMPLSRRQFIASSGAGVCGGGAWRAAYQVYPAKWGG